jgi:hypothetical protein
MLDGPIRQFEITVGGPVGELQYCNLPGCPARKLVEISSVKNPPLCGRISIADVKPLMNGELVPV